MAQVTPWTAIKDPEFWRMLGQSGARYFSDPENALRGASLATTALPLVPDVLGLAADAVMYAKRPEERTAGNYALTGVGLLPGVPAVAGMIRKGGDPNLFLTHETSPEGLLPFISGQDAGRKSLTAPSVAVSKNHSPFFQGEGVSLQLNPRSFDPAVNPRAKLYNRDVWSYTRRNPVSNVHLKEASRDPVGMQSSIEQLPPGHVASIYSSRAHPSFADYEKAGDGAGTLEYTPGDLRDLYHAFNTFVRQDMGVLTGQNVENSMTRAQFLRLTEEMRNPSNKDWQMIRDMGRIQPSEYAEMKIRGPVPIDRTSIMSAVVPNTVSTHFKGSTYQSVAQQLRNMGIPVYEPDKVAYRKAREVWADISPVILDPKASIEAVYNVGKALVSRGYANNPQLAEWMWNDIMKPSPVPRLSPADDFIEMLVRRDADRTQTTEDIRNFLNAAAWGR